MPISVAIVEDNPDFRLGTSYILKSSKECIVAGEYENAEDFIDSIDQVHPDVVLMDIGLPGISGIEATEILKKHYPRLQIVILSVHEDDDNVFKAICAGAIGYVTKPIMPNQLLEAVDFAFTGGTPMSPHIARKVLQMFKDHVPPQKADYNLTERELEVLDHLVQGEDYKVIADRMILSVFTIRAHIRNIYDKLHVHSKSQAVSKTLKEGLLHKR
jgi:DNA-binding NarL/FixJ family response regulator